MQRYIKSDWERTDMASGPIWDKDNWRIIEKSDFDSEDKFYILRDKSNQRAKDKRFNTLAEAMNYVDFRANLNSSRKINSSQKGFENVVEGTQYDDYHIDTRGQGILSVENIIEEIEGRGNQAVLTVQTSDGSTNHSQFGSKDWKEYKDSVNNAGNAITDVWVTEVEGGSYVRNSRKITSARYIATDPETGEVLGSADTYEEAINEWGEDVTITDSEATEGQEDMEGGLFSNKRPIKSSLHTEVVENFPEYMVFYAVYGESGYGEDGVDDVTDEDIKLYEEWRERNGYGTCFGRGSVYDESHFSSNPAFGLPCTVIPVVFEVSNSVTSSKKPETTKQFITRILSELETGEITEDEAAEEIAESNDVNIGYARQILSSYIADKDRYITSGMLELGDALNVEFDPDGNLDSWSVDFATDPEKPAPTLGGELVRAARYIISAFRDNDEKVGWGYAREVLNPAARFIVENTEYKQNDVFEDLLDGQTYNDDAYRQFIDMFETDFADYLRDHEELFHKLNKKSFEENVNDEDEYSSIDYFSVNNEHVDYWFKYEDGQYVCDNVDPVVNQEWNEGDIITAEDFPFDNIDFNEEYGTFDYDDGFIYSWEDGDGESVRISNVEYKYSEFEEGDVLTPDELENLAENGYEFHDANGNEIRISDIM